MDKFLCREVIHAIGYLGTHHCQTFLYLKNLQCAMNITNGVQ